MNDYIILSLVPAYKEAPSSYELFKSNTEEILKLLSKSDYNKKYLLINKEEAENLNLREKYNNLLENIQLIETKYTDGFVFNNQSALLNVLENEKPIPANKENIYFLEEFMQSEKKTVYIFGAVQNKGMHKMDKKTTAQKILGNLGLTKGFKGMYFGYPMGVFISKENLNEEIELKTDYIEIYDENSCMLDSLLNIAKRFLNESCGRCVLGYEGTTQINMILNDISMKKGKASDLELFADLCSQMRNQCLCDIGSNLAEAVISCINNFKEEIEEHINKKNCRALVCGKFVTYHILQDKCIGCTECMDACDDDAILGKKNYIHVIDQDECTQCGKCIDSCDMGAIVKAGLMKPKSPVKSIPCKAK